MQKKSRHPKDGAEKVKLKNKFIMIITVIIAIALTVSLGVLIPQLLNKNENEVVITNAYEPKIEHKVDLSEDDTNKEESSTTKTDLVSDMIEIIDENTNTEVVETEDNNEVDKVDSTEDTEVSVEDVVSDEVDSMGESDTAIEDAGTDSNTSADVDTSDNQEQDNDTDNDSQYVKDGWVDDMIQDNMDEINQNDLAVGAAIYNKLDTQYIFGLAANGLTDEEKIELRDYLNANLTQQEVEIAMSLYNKYVGLVD